MVMLPRHGRVDGRSSGFTLMELLVVMVILGLLLTISLPNYLAAVDRARDTTLRENLRVMRVTLDQFLADRGRYPRNLDELVESGYLRSVPLDPITRSNQTWQVLQAPPRGQERETGNRATGVADVRSGAPGNGRDGRSYASY